MNNLKRGIMLINLYHGDCLEIMKEIPDGSVVKLNMSLTAYS